MTATSNTSGLSSDMKITPMIDILPVLLIIFMMIVPAMPRGETAAIPQSAHRIATPKPVVLEVLKGTGNAVEYRIHQKPVVQGELQARLAEVYANRTHSVLFLKGDDRLSKQIADVIDSGHVASIDQINLMTPEAVSGNQARGCSETRFALGSQEYNLANLVSVSPARRQVHDFQGAQSIGTT